LRFDVFTGGQNGFPALLERNRPAVFLIKEKFQLPKPSKLGRFNIQLILFVVHFKILF